MDQSPPVNRFTVVRASDIKIVPSIFKDPNCYDCRFEDGFMPVVKSMIMFDPQRGSVHAAKDLYEVHKAWALRARRKPVSQKVLAANLVRLGCTVRHTERGNVWTMPG